MNNKGLYIKAMVLLTVFSMNTVMSFACSLSSFVHSFHHSVSSSKQAGLHHHAHETADHHHGEEKMPVKGDECCSADLVKVEKADKSPGRSIQLPLPPLQGVFIGHEDYTFYNHMAFGKDIFADAWRWRPPATIQDLRIVIQSFQI